MNKKAFPLILVSCIAGLLIVGFLEKGKLNEYISRKMQEQAGSESVTSAEKKIRENYNYVLNRQNFEFTLLEFGSTGCIPCSQMEPVLDEIRQLEIPKVNVVFLHIMKSENQDLMKYYGISAVPVQILLDREGKEFFRHFGYIPARDLQTEFSGYLSTNKN